MAGIYLALVVLLLCLIAAQGYTNAYDNFFFLFLPLSFQCRASVLTCSYHHLTKQGNLLVQHILAALLASQTRHAVGVSLLLVHKAFALREDPMALWSRPVHANRVRLLFSGRGNLVQVVVRTRTHNEASFFSLSFSTTVSTLTQRVCLFLHNSGPLRVLYTM